MDKQNVIYTHRKEGGSDTCYATDEPEDRTLSEINQTQKDTCCLIPLTGSLEESDPRRQEVDCGGQGLGEGLRSQVFKGTGILSVVMKMF